MTDKQLPKISKAQKKPETVKGRGRHVGDREGKRKELLAAGITVIAEHGFAGASLRKVATKAGYTTGAVTYYFENKEALVAAIIEQMFDEWDDLTVSQDQPYDTKARMRRWLAMNADSDVWLAQFQLLARARHEPAFAEIYERRYAAYRAHLAKRLAAQQKVGKVRDDIPADLLADHLGAIGDGWMMMLPIEPHRFEQTRLELLLDSIEQLLAPPAP